MKVCAHAAQHAKSSLEIFHYEMNELGADEVEVAVTHCGICHSDVHLVDNDWESSVYPLVPGHEIIGIVSAVGANVKHIKVDQRVGIGWQCGSCLTCEWCRRGEENLCARSQAVAIGHHGGFAERVRAHGRFVLPIPEKMLSETVAPLLCAGITVYSPLRVYGVQSNMRVGIIGIGGLGHLALQFASAFGCEVTAFSSNPGKESDCKRLGAHHFALSTDTRMMQKYLNSFDFILSTVNIALDWGSYLDLLRPHGTLCFVGAAGQINIPMRKLVSGDKKICGSLIGAPDMISEMLHFAARHQIQAMTQRMPMSKANEALDLVRRNKARYRIVLCNALAL